MSLRPLEYNSVGQGYLNLLPVLLPEVVRQYDDCLARRRVEQAIRQHSAQLEALREVGLELTARLDLDALLHSIVSRAMELVGGGAACLYLHRPKRDVLEVVVAAGPNTMPIGSVLRRGEGLSGKVWETGESLTVDDYQQWAGRAAVYQGLPSKAVVGVPVRWGLTNAGGELLGVLNIQADTPHVFSPTDVELLNLFATQAAIAIHNVQLYDEIRVRATHLEALNRVVATAAGASDLSDLLETALEYTLRALEVKTGGIWMVDRHASRGLPSGIALATAQAARTAGVDIPGPVVVEDWEQTAAGSPLAADSLLSVLAPLMARFGIRASLTVPILTEGQRVGGLHVVSPAPRPWSTEEVALAEAIGGQLGAAAERLHLFQAEQEQRELAEALAEAAAVVSSSLHLDQVLDRILEQVERIVAGDAFNIMLVEGGTAQTVRWRGYDCLGVAPPPIVGTLPIAEFSTLARMAQTGEPLVIPDTAADPGWVSLRDRDWVRSYVAAPIRVGGKTVGFLNVNGTQPGQFGPADGLRLMAFANHTAIAIENARLYRGILDHAEQLEQRVAERTAELQAQYGRLDAILNSTVDGIVVVDGEGNVIQTNPAAQAWLTQTLSPEGVGRVQEAVRDLARQAGTEAVPGKRPGRVVELTGLDLELRVAPISEPSRLRKVLGQAPGEPAAVVTIHDVSHLKALDRMKTVFIDNVSHELRTPITTIKLYAHLVQRTPPEDEEWGKHLDALGRVADAQAQLGEDILQISRIYAGKLELELRPVSLNELTEAAVASHQALAQERGLTLEYRPETRFSPKNLVSLVDPKQMMRVLNNLVGDAIRYTPEWGHVLVSTGKEEAEGGVWATVAVSDTGEGIPEGDLPYIFERFFREDEPQAKRISETGLRLMIVKGIVELHGGRVTVESPSTTDVPSGSGQAPSTRLRAGEEGVGSTFTVWLPLTG